ncbi:MAG: hypothetical protein M1833_003014 [Piccolia ochrophora]|nr:MAG: hypothetical protein M1833_003014 [Piccolia ochrophora]
MDTQENAAKSVKHDSSILRGDPVYGCAIESRSGHIFCQQCQDFVYDPTLEEVRSQKRKMGMPNEKKRKLDELYPSPDDERVIAQNSTVGSCRTPGLRGFFNMGQTCYMSVILQSLIHNPLLRNYFLADGHRPSGCTIENCLSCAVEEMYSEFYGNEKTEGYAAVNILSRSWILKQDMAGCHQQDAHEYFQFLVDRLHSEIGGDEAIDSEHCKCILHRVYYGKLRSDVTCSNCKNVTSTEDPILDLSLDIKRQAKRQKLSHGAPGSPTNRLSLHACLDHFTSAEKLAAAEYNCSKCNAQRPATKQLSIKQLPPVLCIQFKRFEAGFEAQSATASKLEMHVDFPLQLDMSPYSTRSVGSKKGELGELRRTCTYDLSSVIVHIGKLSAGHYISYSREGGRWYKFDDHKVCVVSDIEVMNSSAYLLVYVVRNLA